MLCCVLWRWSAEDGSVYVEQRRVATSVVVMPEVGRCKLVNSLFPVTLRQAQYRIVGMRNGRFDGRRLQLQLLEN